MLKTWGNGFKGEIEQDEYSTVINSPDTYTGLVGRRSTPL